MKTKMLITILFVVAVLTACSPVVAPLEVIFPTPQPTPYRFTSSDSVNVQWGWTLQAGETGTFDKDGKIVNWQDAQGQVKLENLGNDRYKYYARVDGYDSIVGDGILPLKAGYSYTFSLYETPEQIEIRQISDDQFIGYLLLIEAYDSNGSFVGFEPPFTIVDVNNDGLVNVEELSNAIVGLNEEVKLLTESQPTYADQFESEITSANEAINRGAIADAYRKIKQLKIELATLEKAINDQAVNK